MTSCKDSGIDTVEADSTDKAFAILEGAWDIRFVLTDARMPGRLDGVQLARLVGLRWPGIKVVLASGYTQPGAAKLPKGILILAKPFTLAPLLSLIAAA